MKYFTSDLHHEHRNIVKFTNRGVDTDQENHTKWLREVWNSQVKAGDLVYHLGDFSFGRSYMEIRKFIDSLNGHKILIKGNHDSSDILDRLKGDNSIIKWTHYEEIKIKNNSVVLFHFPISSWHKQGHGSWHLHGHCHGNHKDNKGYMLDVGIDNVYNLTGQHKFLSEDDIYDIMQSKQVYISDNHRENI